MGQSTNQFQLLKQRRFLPFFVTQALGAFNDNVFKNALFILITYQFAASATESGILTNFAAVIFIFPFFIFSATAGQIADKFEKSMIIRRVKMLEIVIMCLAMIGFYFQSIYFLIGVLFLMGTQSSLFGPVKYGYLPQQLSRDELVGGNAWLQTGTFLAILLGTLVGGLLIKIENIGSYVVAGTVIVIALFGYLASRSVPFTQAVEPKLNINWNIFTETHKNFKFIKSNRAILLSVVGISWFWFFGATILAQIASYTKYTLGGDETVATLLLTAFSLGIGIGSLLCERLSGHKIEIGLVPLGAAGLSYFAIDMYFAQHQVGQTPSLDFQAFLQGGNNIRVVLDAMLLGMFGGFYIVPLNALIQHRSEPHHVARVVAGNNILNAFFMVLSGAVAMALLAFGFTVPEIILTIGILNGFVTLYIFKLMPEFVMRFLVWVLISLFYRIRVSGLENIPDKGPAVLACNHVSFMDAMIIGGTCRRPVRFIMDHKIYNLPVLHFIFKTAGAIPIAPAHQDKALMEKAFEQAAKYLESGDIVAIFPEGKITGDGNINEFKAGIEQIVERTPVPVIPMAIQGLWGSFFSRRYGNAMTHIPKRFWSKIGLQVGRAIAPQDLSSASLQESVIALRGKWK